MEIRLLRYFLAVAQEESISKAADILHITQPTLSRQLMDLEKELNTKLLIRGKRNKKITLTEDGKLLKSRAQEIIELTNKTESEFLFGDKNISGDIFIGGGETDAIRVIARTIKRLSLEYPNIKYHFYSGNGEDVTEKLNKGLLDFGVFIEPIDKKEYGFIQLPQNDTWGILMRKDSDLAKKEFIEPEDLINIPLFSSRQYLVKNLISGWLGFDFEKLNIIGSYNLLYNASVMVEEGLGYALCIDKLINISGDSKLCFKPLKPKLEAGILVAWTKNQPLSKIAKLFIQKLQEEITD
jgi:DNA-binding transcriptional LysR family regulator|uniref:LysR family transcriptional regulator n=1 Tax=Candidatus Stercorousia sp. TaxID=3048886 RepID=UPI0040268DBC